MIEPMIGPNNNKRELEQSSETNKRQRPNPEEERVQEMANRVFGDDGCCLEILSYLTPYEFSRASLVSRRFSEFIGHKHNEIGKLTKLAIAKNGYPTYFLKLFCEGDGSFIYLENYFELIHTTEDNDKKALLIDFLVQKLPNIFGKIGETGDLDCFNQVLDAILQKPISNKISRLHQTAVYTIQKMMRTDDYFSNFEKYLEQLNNCDTDFKRKLWISAIEEELPSLLKEIEAKGQFDRLKFVFNAIFQPFILENIDVYTSDLLAVFSFKMRSFISFDKISSFDKMLWNSHLNSHSKDVFIFLITLQYVLNKSFTITHKPSIQIDIKSYMRLLHDCYQIQSSHEKRCAYQQLSNEFARLIKDFFINTDFQTLDTLMAVLPSLRLFIKKLNTSDFDELLQCAISQSSSSSFDALCEARFDEARILMYSVVYNLGSRSDEGWTKLKKMASKKRSLWHAIAQVIKNSGQVNVLPHFLFIVPNDASKITLQVLDYLFSSLDEEKRLEIVSQTFEKMKSKRNPIKFMIRYCSFSEDFQKKIIDFVAEKYMKKQKIYSQFFIDIFLRRSFDSKLIEHYDGHIKSESARNEIYSSILKSMLEDDTIYSNELEIIKIVLSKLSKELQSEWVLKIIKSKRRVCGSENLLLKYQI
ncbi:MAG: hypothetical protein K940chlam3_00501 [Chlamydiae bacterium]|nr:hypothetical protein [Chlamydiota bacterium]